MLFLVTHPDLLATATADLAAVGSATTAIVAAAHQVRALSAAQFVAHAQIYHAVSAQASAIHEQFTATLAASAGSYAATETANAGRGHLSNRRKHNGLRGAPTGDQLQQNVFRAGVWAHAGRRRGLGRDCR